MKVIFILFLCFLVNLVSAQDFQYRIDSNVNTVKIDSIGKIVRELRNYNTKGNNRIYPIGKLMLIINVLYFPGY